MEVRTAETLEESRFRFIDEIRNAERAYRARGQIYVFSMDPEDPNTIQLTAKQLIHEVSSQTNLGEQILQMFLEWEALEGTQ